MSYSLSNCFASLPRTVRGQPIILGGDPKGKNFLYTNGNSVIIRDIANPHIADVYTEHSVQTTVAKYSPNGFYIASADISGKVRIWDTTQKEHILKNEFQPISGPIKDLAWTNDSQRIVVGGEGRERFGHVFNAETGTSVGDIMGQTKPFNAVDFRGERPFRIATASEDTSVGFYHGPPFKFQFTIRDHTNFVNALKYAPNGEVFVTGGADCRAYLYDGKTGEKKGQLGDPAHKGGIYGVCFSPDSQQVLTVSGDKTCKIWKVADGSLVQEFEMGTTVNDMQVGCLWQGEHILSVSLSGAINYLDINNPTTPLRVIKGHNKPITALSVSKDRSRIYTASSDGVICHWNAKTGENDVIEGKGHSNQVQDMLVCDDSLITCGMDDTLIYSPGERAYGDRVKLPSQPRGLAAAPGGLVVVACINEVVVVRNGQVMFSQKVDYEPLCASIHPTQVEVAVGAGSENDAKIHIYDLDENTLKQKRTLSQTGSIRDVAYSPSGQFLAACDSNRKVCLYDVPEIYKEDESYKAVVTTEWTRHTARINSLDWTADSQHVATGALDTHFCVWTPEKKTSHIVGKGAHPMSQVNRVAWLDETTLITVGQDSNVKKWTIEHV